MPKYKVKCGFTLIELSIVLVIVALVMGGILLGRELINIAQVQKTVSAYTQYQTALNAFRLRYNALPGDMTNATSIWGTDVNCPTTAYNTAKKTATCNGNGDGVVGKYTDLNLWYEATRFWQQLANSDLISGQYTGAAGPSGNGWDFQPNLNVPAGNLPDTCWGITDATMVDVYAPTYYYPATGKLGNAFVLGKPVTDSACGGPGILPVSAYSIDVKLDDGLPASGKIVTEIFSSPNAPNCATSDTPADAIYNSSNNSYVCNLYLAIK